MLQGLRDFMKRIDLVEVFYNQLVITGKGRTFRVSQAFSRAEAMVGSYCRSICREFDRIGGNV